MTLYQNFKLLASILRSSLARETTTIQEMTEEVKNEGFLNFYGISIENVSFNTRIFAPARYKNNSLCIKRNTLLIFPTNINAQEFEP